MPRRLVRIACLSTLLGALLAATDAARSSRLVRAAEENALPATGSLDPRLESFDRLLREFVAEHGIPGAALAVTDQGRLVFARGYGWADQDANEPVQPTSLFRIASISKPITAAAILGLVAEGKLRLDDRLVDVLPIARWAEDEKCEPDPRLSYVTLRHLLEHRGGWDRDVSFDPMFRAVEFAQELGKEPPATTDVVIRAMLRRPLDFDPGERYAYSNYGYCLLGRVIEKVTGEAYEDHVRKHVLAPLGIEAMRIGRTRLEGRAPNEVRYHHPGMARSCFASDLGERVAWPYGGFHLEAMDAHGGWIASAVDLVRFAVAFDRPDRCPLFSAEHVSTMFERPPGLAGHEADGSPKDVWYSLGWSVRDAGKGRRNTWHTGSLPGTATLLVRRHDGRNWAVLFNTRVSAKEGPNHLGREIDSLLHRAANEVKEWPKEDLFAKFQAKKEKDLTAEDAGKKEEDLTAEDAEDAEKKGD